MRQIGGPRAPFVVISAFCRNNSERKTHNNIAFAGKHPNFASENENKRKKL